MTEIEELLRLGKSTLDEAATPISEAELRAAEASLPFRLPASYREFDALGGLRELRIKHRVLNPSEMQEALQYVDQERKASGALRAPAASAHLQR